jgi:hypothetical protein
VDQWLTQARTALAHESGVPADQLELEDDAGARLELAPVAGHESGECANAPPLCYPVRRARSGASLDQLAGAVRRSTS